MPKRVAFYVRVSTDGQTVENQLGELQAVASRHGDADHDVVAALEQWVEKGIAPKRIIATKYVDNDRTKTVEMTRPLCVYPQAANTRGLETRTTLPISSAPIPPSRNDSPHPQNGHAG